MAKDGDVKRGASAARVVSTAPSEPKTEHVWRERLVHRVWREAGPVSSVVRLVAPPGYGKTVLIEQVLRRVQRFSPWAITVSASDCEGHLGLFVASLNRRIRAILPSADTRGLVSAATESMAMVVQRFPKVLMECLQHGRSGPVMLAIDALDAVDPDDDLGLLIAGLIDANVDGLGLLLASRLPWGDPPEFGEATEQVLGAQELAFNLDEAQELFGDLGPSVGHDVIAGLHELMGGWPEALDICVQTGGDGGGSCSLPLAPNATHVRLVERHLAMLGSHARYLTSALAVSAPCDVRHLASLVAPTQRALASSSHIVELSSTHVEAAIAELQRVQLVRTATEFFELQPLVRHVVYEQLASKSMELRRQWHRRAAATLLERSTESSSEVPFEALRHLADGHAFSELLATLEGVADDMLGLQQFKRLYGLLEPLERHFSELPFWCKFCLGRVYSHRREWAKARDYFDECREKIQRQPVDAHWFPRLQLGYAELFWRRGVHSDARTYSRRGLDYLRQQGLGAKGDALASTRLELMLLRARLRTDAGALQQATERFSEALELADKVASPGVHVQARCELATLALRRGDTGSAQRHSDAALEVAETLRHPADMALALSVSAQTAACMGRQQEARTLMLRAGAMVASVDEPAVSAENHYRLACFYAAGRESALADHHFKVVLSTCHDLGSLPLEVELKLSYTAFLGTTGRHVEARKFFRQADRAYNAIVRPESVLVARREQALLEVQLAEGRGDRALARLTGIAESFERMGALHDLYKTYWRAVEIHHALFMKGVRDTPETVISYMELAATIGNRCGFSPQLGTHELLVVGSQFGLPQSQDFCERWLTSHEAAAAAAPEHVEEAERLYQRFIQGHGVGADYILTRTDETLELSEAEAEQHLSTLRSESVLVVAVEQAHMWNYGRSIPLGQKRVILPLLIHFLRHGHTSYSVAEIAAQVWCSPTVDDPLRTKVKVAISRLRALLGKERPYIVTARRKEQGGGTIVTYGLHPDIEYALFEKVVTDVS